MAIVSRPLKTGGSGDYVAGNDVLADECNADANTIYDEFNGNITDANCSLTMNLLGTKLADAPAGIPASKLNTASVTTNKIADNNVTIAKLKNVVIEDISHVFAAPGAGNNYVKMLSYYLVDNAGHYEIVVSVGATNGSNAYLMITATLVPVTPISTSTKHVLNVIPTLTAGNFVGNTPVTYSFRVISIDKV